MISVHKFGGTSVGSPPRIRNVIDLVGQDTTSTGRIVVVSAFGGVTDQLLSGIDSALARTGGHPDVVADVRARHLEAIDALVAPDERDVVRDELDGLFRELGELLDGVYLLRECTDRSRDAVLGCGERASAPIVAAAFRAAGHEAAFVDARTLVRTDSSFGEAVVDADITASLVQAGLGSASGIKVVTGFIASNSDGVQTTLGRSGSDYTATIIAGALNADRVVIWTDVDGVLSADPRLVPGAFTLPTLSYREAGEMAYFGAKVLHPRTMRPLLQNGIPLQIKNTMNPAAAGTRIQTDSVPADGAVKAVTAIRGVAVVMVQGAGMVGIPGISARAFGALAAADVNILLISQASSEQSICVGVRDSDSARAVASLKKAFELELLRGDVSDISAERSNAIVSVVGDDMRLHPGIAGRMFSTFGYANINVRAIAQGAAETNISAVVSDSDAQRAIRALHESFARQYDRAHLFVIGTGVVGTAFLGLLAEHAPLLSEKDHLNLRLVGVANSRRMVMDADGIDPALAGELLGAGEACDLDGIINALQESHLERLVLVDATASGDVADRYEELLRAGIAVVTPNKRANTASLDYWDRLHERHSVPFLYETTVGAALPVIGAVQDLVRSGDSVRRIEGVLSGTLAYVFGLVAAGSSFSGAVLKAKAQGFTEPDPRDDLGGEDVARKILTLAREAGWRFERTDIEVESLVPGALAGVSIQEYLDRLPEFDSDWEGRSGSMQYVAEATATGIRVGVQEVAGGSPFSRLEGTDNMVVFTTDRYHERPLVIQGAGAGPIVTSGGMMADVVRAAEAMG